MKKRWFVGIDISKDQLDVAVLTDPENHDYLTAVVKNSFAGFDDLQQWLVDNGVDPTKCYFCMENTGTYNLLLLHYMQMQHWWFCVENPHHLKKSIGLQRGKNDQVDAKRIAEYAFMSSHKLQAYQMPAKNLIKIKQRLTYREQLVKTKTSFKNCLKSHEHYNALTESTHITEEIEDYIENLKQKIKNIEKEIDELIKADSSIKKNYDLATSVTGVGPILASYLMVTTHNFSLFKDGRKYACYVGVAPFEYESGSSIRKNSQVSELGNKTIKSLFHNGVNSAIQHDPELRTYSVRKIEEGKHKMKVKNAVVNKLITRVFASVKRGTPYVRFNPHIYAN